MFLLNETITAYSIDDNSKKLGTVNFVLQEHPNSFLGRKIVFPDNTILHNVTLCDELPDIISVFLTLDPYDYNMHYIIPPTALMYAAALSTPEESYRKTARILLDHGANVNLKNSDGLTALDLTEYDPNMYRLLQSYGATGKNS